MDVADQLDSEWPRLARDTVARALPCWQQLQPDLRPFASPQRLLAFLHSASARQTDAPLLALLALAQAEQRLGARRRLGLPARETVAGRTLVQVLLPGLKTQAARIVYPSARREEVWEALLYFAWEAICSYPLRRRRIDVASKLYFDVLHQTTRELQRERRAAADGQSELEVAPLLSEPVDEACPSAAADTPEPGAAGGQTPPEAVVLAGLEAGLLAPRDAELILLTRLDRIPLRLIAQTERVSYCRLLKRRQRAEAALRRLPHVNRDVRKSPLLTLVSYESAISPAERARALTLMQRDAPGTRAA